VYHSVSDVHGCFSFVSDAPDHVVQDRNELLNMWTEVEVGCSPPPVVYQPGIDVLHVVGIAFAAFCIGCLLIGVLWFIHAHTGKPLDRDIVFVGIRVQIKEPCVYATVVCLTENFLRFKNGIGLFVCKFYRWA
jgi:hypothetical protein